MGLDIYVIKPCPPEEADKDKFDDILGYCYTENPRIVRSFPKFVIEKDDELYDFKATGHPEWFSEDFIKKNGYGWIWTSDRYILLDNDSYGNGYYTLDSIDILNMKEFESHIIGSIPIKDIPTYTAKVPIVPYQEVGYQRKGANNKFYEDGKWDDPEKNSAVTLKELEEDYEKYFSHPEPDSKGDGFGSTVEFNLSDTEMSERFKKNIMSKFVDGETAVVYW